MKGFKTMAYFMVVALILLVIDITGMNIAYSIELMKPHNASDDFPPDPTVEDYVGEYLRQNGWVKKTVSNDELKRYLTMAEQATDLYDDITTGQVIATIAVESRFDPDAGSSPGAIGLMQLIPQYHSDRLKNHMDDSTTYDEDLFFDPWLNIVTGCDYLQQIMSDKEVGGDVTRCGMWYNQGAISASTMWNQGLYSSYALTVEQLTTKLNSIISTVEKG